MDIFLHIVTWLVDIACTVLPAWKLPDFLITGFNYFMFTIAGLAHAVPFIESIILCLSLMIIYKTSVIIANLSFGLVALIRGSGKPEI